MKKRYILLVALLLLLPIAAAEDAIPDIKNATIFRGTVRIDGSVPADGTTVEAKAGSVLRGSDSGDSGGTSGGNFELAVFASNETLTFYVRGIAAQTYSLLASDKARIIYLNLSTTTSTGGGGGGGGNGGSGGGGGGGGASGENASNIELIEKYDKEILKDVLTSYMFTHAKNPIRFVNITGMTNLGLITASVEVLKGTSTLVKNPPEGNIYRNVNIWVGTSGFATPKNIKAAVIKFKIDNDWMSSNGISGNDIVLLKWDGTKWIQLETKEVSKDGSETFFESKTDSFSPFAIASKTTAPKPTVTTTAPGTVTPTATPVTPPGKATGILTWLLYLIIIVVIGAAVYYFVVNKPKK